MKLTFFVSAIIVFCLLYQFLPAQNNNSTLIQLIQEEQNNLSMLEGEIQYYYSLIQKRKEIKSLYQNGNLVKIKKLFNEDAKAIDNILKSDDIKEVSIKVGELKIAYRDVPELKDQILYYRGYVSFLKRKDTKAVKMLEEIVNKYPLSSKRNGAIQVLQEIYFGEGADSLYIAISGKYTAPKSDYQLYRLAQSYYNIGNIEKAKKIFNGLINNKQYALRSKEMLALISYTEKGADVAINNFLKLQTEYRNTDSYYDFIILSLARLYAIKKETDKSFSYYAKYMSMHPDQVSDDILYEVATLYKNNSQYDQAVHYYTMIINKPQKSEYYTSAKFLIMLTEMERGNFDKIGDKLNGMISVNNLLLEALNSKYKLLQKYSETKEKLISSDISEAEKTKLSAKKKAIEGALQQTNDTLMKLSSNLDPTSLLILQLLEEEYLSYSNTISEMDAVVKLANVVPNKRIPKKIDQEIEASDSDLIILQVIEYLGHLQKITPQDLEIAKALAEEKYYEKYLVDSWNEIGQLAIDHNHPQILPYVKHAKSLLEDNIVLLDKVAEKGFGGKAPEELSSLIQDESKQIESNKKELVRLKKEVIEKFNKKIAKKLDKEKDILVEENGILKSTYTKAMTDVENQIKEENAKYNISLLDILFQQSQRLDQEYKKFQEKLKNE